MRSLFKFKKLWVIILNTLLIVFSSTFIWHSEKFQEKIAPKRFWENKIKNLQSQLKRDDIKIKNLQLDLEKEISLSFYHEKQAKINAEANDKNPSDVYIAMQNDHLKKVIDIRKKINSLKDDESRIKFDLKIAKTKKNSIE